MSKVNYFILLAKPSQVKKSPTVFQHSKYLQYCRGFADKPKSDTVSKQVVTQGTEKEERLRIRRTRPTDVPRVLRFVRENSRVAWPSFDNPQAKFHLILGDYVSRALAQGHSMLAEQQEPKRGWNQIRGLAINTTVCPWDALTLDRWAKCIKCQKSRQLVHFTAHCLRAPSLHDKYQVHNILQVILIVPPDVPRAADIVHLLAKKSMKRGEDVGIPVLRFDVTNDSVAKALGELNLTKEWEISYILPSVKNERKESANGESKSKSKDENKQEENIQSKNHFIAVYTNK